MYDPVHFAKSVLFTFTLSSHKKSDSITLSLTLHQIDTMMDGDEAMNQLAAMGVPINRHQIWWLPTLVEALNRDPTVTSGL
jgi:hypothetical protein